MYGCESWTVKKAEHQRIDAFEVWCWRRLLRVSWTARSSNQSILREISPKYSLEGLMLKLKLQYFGHLMRSTDSLEKSPDAGQDWRQEKGLTEDEMVGWHHGLDGHEFKQALGVGDEQGSLVCCRPWARSQTKLNDWTITSSLPTATLPRHAHLLLSNSSTIIGNPAASSLSDPLAIWQWFAEQRTTFKLGLTNLMVCLTVLLSG